MDQASRLRIRDFVEGRDEDEWIRLFNSYYGHYYGREFEPLDEDDIEWNKRTPWWRDSRILMADLGGRAVGMIRAYVDRARSPPKGYIYDLAVELELEETKVPRALLEEALSWLEGEGASSVQAYARDNMEARIRLYREEGFKLIRSFSVMRLRADELPEGVRANEEVELRVAKPLEDEEDLRTLNYLSNEAFSEHFDFSPESLEETRVFFEHEGYEDLAVLAYLGGEPVGYVVATVSKDLPELDFKRGFIMSIGVLKPHRRRGIGTALMLRAMRWLVSKGVEVIELTVDDDNPTGAPAFYASLGFRRAFRTLVFLKELKGEGPSPKA